MLKNSVPTLSSEGQLSEEQLVTDASALYNERSATRMNRRRLITGLSMAAGAAGMLGVAGCTSDGTVSIPSPDLHTDRARCP